MRVSPTRSPTRRSGLSDAASAASSAPHPPPIPAPEHRRDQADAGRYRRTTIKGIRDAAVTLLGFASALRRSELADLNLADVELKPEGLLVHVRQSKGDPEKRGQLVGVARGNHPDTDPIAALDAWLDLRTRDSGRLFLAVRNEQIGPQPFTGSGLARMLKDRAAAVDLPSERISGHSLRAGHATTAAMAGVGLDRIAAQTRHTRISTLVEHYISPLEALQVTSSRDLGL